MHIMFTEVEKQYIDTKKFGFPIKAGCPERIKKSIEKKKKLLDNQGVGLLGGQHGRRKDNR